MQSKSKNENQIEANPYNISPSTVCGEPWWRTSGYSSISPAVIRGNASNSSSLEQSIDGHSQSDGRFNEEDDDATKESENTAPCSGISLNKCANSFCKKNLFSPQKMKNDDFGEGCGRQIILPYTVEWKMK